MQKVFVTVDMSYLITSKLEKNKIDVELDMNIEKAIEELSDILKERFDITGSFVYIVNNKNFISLLNENKSLQDKDVIKIMPVLSGG